MAMKLLQKTRIVAIRAVTPRVREIELEHALRDRLKPFEAGSHVTVSLPGGFNRQYSLCGDPSEDARYRLGVLLTDPSRGGSRAMHGLQEGGTLFVSYPANSFALAEDATHHVLLAGGIGVTPILSMAHALAAKGASFEVHYGARSRADLAFVDELQGLCPPGALHLYADDDTPAARPDLAALLGGAGEGVHVYACGPQPMLDALEGAAAEAGTPPERVHLEQFGALAAGERQGAPFEIAIEGSDEVVAVAEDASALEALRAAGHIVPSSCEGGICGECRLRLVEGEAIHRDKVLSPDERKSEFICCVSRGEGRLTVALPPQPKPAR